MPLPTAVYVLVFLAKFLAAGGGLGAGGLLIPVFLLVGDCSASQAAPLSACAIAGGAVTNYAIYYSRRTPDGSSPVAYEAALLMLPTLLAGSTLGKLLNAVLPQAAIVLLLFATLSYASWKTTLKGVAGWRAEGKLRARSSDPSGDGDGDSEGGEGCSGGAAAPPAVETLPPLQPQPPVPPRVLPLSAASWSVVLLSAVARSRAVCGSASYFGMLFLSWAALGTMLALTRHLLLSDAADAAEAAAAAETAAAAAAAAAAARPAVSGAVACGAAGAADVAQQPPPGAAAAAAAAPLELTPSRTAFLSAACFGVGVAAGLLGIGGGTLLGPLLLEIGAPPRSVAATCSFLLLLADTAITAQYGLAGQLPAGEGAALALTSAAATGLGQVASERLIVASGGRASTITLIIAGITAASTVTTGGVAVGRLVGLVGGGGGCGGGGAPAHAAAAAAAAAPGAWSFRPLCASRGGGH